MGTKFSIVFRCLNSRRILTAIGALALLAFLLGISPQPALAQGGVDDPLGPFQLEGNATTEPVICFKLTSAGAITALPSGGSCGGLSTVTFGANTDDWENALGIGGLTGHALATSFVGPATNPAEQVNSLNDTTFFGGGSKDTLGISSGPWEFTTTSVQAKDDIEHAYAAAYTLKNNHTAIYFGMDRVDNSGDATAGFWFLQDSTVSLNGAKKGGGNLFTGHHTNNDLLIVADYGIGGGTPEVRVFTWSCGANTGAACDSLGTLKAGSDITNTSAQCDPTSGSSSFCAITNGSDGLTAPWGFVNSKNVTTTMAHGEFLEGGLDLETVFGANIPCFSLFFAETRSSTSPTASLEDVTPPVSFPLCGIKIKKTCTTNGVLSNGGSTITYTWTVTATNTGIGNLYDVTVLDTLPDGVKTSFDLIDEGTTPNFLAGGTSASGTVTFVVNCSAGVCTGAETGGKVVANPASVLNTADVQAFTAPSSGGTKITPVPDVPSSASCSASAPGAITVEKHCDPTNGGPILVSNGTNVIVEVPFTAKVCVPSTINGVAAEAVNNITMSDSPTATFTSNGTITSIAPGTCATVKGNYFPSAIDSGNGLVAGRYFFSDTLTAKGTGAVDGATITNPANTGGVTCPICPLDECTATPLP